jgi:methionine synthase / methylenetetrahydrofolate reductase (NADH)
MSNAFLDRLNHSVILGDGAMGTQLYKRGVYINRNYDGLNISEPHLVKVVHRDYVQAGANIIGTNTFGANILKLGKHGLADSCFEINRAGAEIARRCADEGAGIYVAGSIGPLGKPIAPVGKISEEFALKSYSTQVDGLLEGGVDLFILETFLDLLEILLAIKVIRSKSDLPIIALMTVDQSGLTAYGRSPQQIAGALNAEDVQVIGLNCSTGPQAILESLKLMREVTDKPLAAFPNAGESRMVEGRLIYMSTPEYFAEYTKRMIQNGVRIIGGCCGTGPDHIRFMASAIRALQPREHDSEVKIASKAVRVKVTETKPVKLKPRGERSRLAKALDNKEFPISCEINPPRSSVTGKILRGVKLLHAAGVNAVNIPDGPRASARMSPMALANIIKTNTKMDTILHYTCRDRNILGMQSDLLGAEALGQDNLLIVTGDPPKLGDYPMATAVFDVDAIGLLRIVNNLNHSLDIVNNPIGKETSFFPGAGFHPGAIDFELEVERLHKKIEAGAEYIMTQPIFEMEVIRKALEKVNRPDIPVFVGILPLASYRNAEFFHNEVPGMDVPEYIRERMRIASDKSKEDGLAEGISIAQEALLAAHEFVQGAYIMPPFGNAEVAIKTISVLEKRPSLEKVLLDVKEGK